MRADGQTGVEILIDFHQDLNTSRIASCDVDQ